MEVFTQFVDLTRNQPNFLPARLLQPLTVLVEQWPQLDTENVSGLCRLLCKLATWSHAYLVCDFKVWMRVLLCACKYRHFTDAVAHCLDVCQVVEASGNLSQPKHSSINYAGALNSLSIQYVTRVSVVLWHLQSPKISALWLPADPEGASSFLNLKSPHRNYW